MKNPQNVHITYNWYIWVLQYSKPNVHYTNASYIIEIRYSKKSRLHIADYSYSHWLFFLTQAECLPPSSRQINRPPPSSCLPAIDIANYLLALSFLVII
ncbi:hypothetical protein VN97_g7212 [Penicillium thymicola]|uniref:Uncharacterized protein n=1 Tax=Penicillium thymicola TaxID=293382 RepID=A0AAI9TGS1_PENTH|nr:hypothetical protein VN97_g7212 [Penicillium thymicola]